MLSPHTMRQVRTRGVRNLCHLKQHFFIRPLTLRIREQRYGNKGITHKEIPLAHQQLPDILHTPYAVTGRYAKLASFSAPFTSKQRTGGESLPTSRL
jgi:hypothetical protein